MNYEVKPFNNEWKLIHEFEKDATTNNKRFKEKEYSAKVFRYQYTDETKHYWDHIKVTIYKNGKEHFTFYRNYPSTPSIVFVEQNNKDYIITSSDYQTIGIIDLTNKTMENYCLGNYKLGWGFCPTSIDAWDDEGKLEVEVHGCFWGGEYEKFIIHDVNLDDFKFPDEIDYMSDSDDDVDYSPDDEDE